VNGAAVFILNLLKVSAGQTPAGNDGFILTSCQSYRPAAAFWNAVDLKNKITCFNHVMLRRANSGAGIALAVMQNIFDYMSVGAYSYIHKKDFHGET
jgi:hypothetical protein